MSDFSGIASLSPESAGPLPQNVLPLIYEELRKRAAALMASERRDHTLQPTALVHEAWLRLSNRDVHSWRNRAHFLACAADAMRWVLVDHARRKRAQRRGGDLVRVDFADAAHLAAPMDSHEFLALNSALERLQKLHPAKAELVKLRFFAGVTLEEAGRLLDISEPTAKRHWAFARAWLFKETFRESAR